MWQGLLGRRPDWGIGPPGRRVSAKDVSAAVGIPMPSITNLWQRWVRSKQAFGGGQVGGSNAVKTEHRRLMKDRV